MKACTTCKTPQPLSNFTRRVSAKDGLNPRCKDCIRKADHQPEVVARRQELRKLNPPKPRRSPESTERRKIAARTYMQTYNKRDKVKILQRRAHVKRKFNMTLEQYDEMLTAQGGVCAICKQTNRNFQNLVIDHCHKTNKVRALLCQWCNQAIGRLNDDPILVRAAAQYLENHS
jgi:hypothetical protein